MTKLRVFKGKNGTWHVTGRLNTSCWEEFDRAILQVLNLPGAPNVSFKISGEEWSYMDLANPQARRLLWERL